MTSPGAEVRMRIWSVVAVGVLLCGCVEEVDPSLRAAEEATGEAAGEAAAAAAAAEDGAPVAPAAEVNVAIRDCAITLGNSSINAGTVALQLRNEGGTQQDLVVRGPEGEWESGPVPAGATATMSLVLTPGTYQIACASAEVPADPSAAPAGATLTVH